MSKDNMVYLESGVEVIKPDLATGFAVLAPLVTAAYAHLQHGDAEKAKSLLHDACKSIEIATMQFLVLPKAEDDNWDEGGGHR